MNNYTKFFNKIMNVVICVVKIDDVLNYREYRVLKIKVKK